MSLDLERRMQKLGVRSAAELFRLYLAA